MKGMIITMAIWQFDFNLIPEEKATNKINCNLAITEDAYDEIIPWKKYTLSESSLKEVSQVLKPTESWSDAIKQFGSVEGTCLKLLYEEDVLIEVSVRLDLRSNTIDNLRLIVNFAGANNAVIITKSGVLIKPTIEDIIEEIKKSDSYAFVKNPKGFLSSLAEQSKGEL